MSTLNVNNINEAGGVDAVITSGVLDSGSLPAGSILQVVRATDSTNQSTTSTSFVDAGISVAITPTSTSSKILLLYSALPYPYSGASAGNSIMHTQITDSSDVAISGAEDTRVGASFGAENDYTIWLSSTISAYDSPASVAEQTYKVRFRADVSTGSARYRNADTTAQLFAIEVAG